MNLGIDEKLNEIIRRVVEAANPEKIILFGSRTRGEVAPDSDFDLLVVVPAPAHRRKTAQKIYMNLIGAGRPVDILVYTKEDLERYKDSAGTIIPIALAEGKVVYAA